MQRSFSAMYFALSFVAQMLAAHMLAAPSAPSAARDIPRGVELSAADIAGDSAAVTMRLTMWATSTGPWRLSSWT